MCEEPLQEQKRVVLCWPGAPIPRCYKIDRGLPCNPCCHHDQSSAILTRKLINTQLSFRFILCVCLVSVKGKMLPNRLVVLTIKLQCDKTEHVLLFYLNYYYYNLNLLNPICED